MESYFEALSHQEIFLGQPQMSSHIAPVVEREFYISMVRLFESNSVRSLPFSESQSCRFASGVRKTLLRLYASGVPNVRGSFSRTAVKLIDARTAAFL